MQPMTLASLSVALRNLPQNPKRSSRAKRALPDIMLTRYAVAPWVFIACSSSFTAASSALSAVVAYKDGLCVIGCMRGCAMVTW